MSVNWKAPAGAKLTKLTITLNGVVQQRLRGSARKATIDLRGRPAGPVVVRITGTLAGGRRIANARTYRPCIGRVATARLPTLRLRYAGRWKSPPQWPHTPAEPCLAASDAAW